MLRVMMLAPFLIFLAARVKQLAPAGSNQKSKITIPWFAILFIVVAILTPSTSCPKR
jgi:Predicted membrane protein